MFKATMEKFGQILKLAKARLFILHCDIKKDYLFCKGKHSNRDTEATPQVILLDINLPKLDGLEVLRQLRANSYIRSPSSLIASWSP